MTPRRVGTAIQVRKLRPDGSLHYSWTGEVVRADASGIVLRAEFNVELVEREWATFRRGDVFHEFYYWSQPYNVYEISSADGTLKGWYGNVGLPPQLKPETNELNYVDLALDVWANPDGSFIVLDEDELKELLQQHPELEDAAEQGRLALVELARTRRMPRWPDQTH